MSINKSTPVFTSSEKDLTPKKIKQIGKRKIFRASHSNSTPQVPKPDSDSLSRPRMNQSLKPQKALEISQKAPTSAFSIKLNKFEKIQLKKNFFSKQPTQTTKPNNPIFNDSTKLSFDFSRRASKIDVACITRTGTIDNKPKTVNQDSLIALKNISGRNNTVLAAVFDGHGPEGHLVSQYVESTFTDLLKSNLKHQNEIKNYDLFFRSIIDETSSQLMSSSVNTTFSGTTFLSVFISNDEMCCASIGDSRAILASFDETWSFKVLNKEHKPYNPEEKQRIELAGGRVGAMKDPTGKPVGPVRAWGRSLNSPGLAMSRTIGDSFAKDFGVTDTPDITVLNLTSADKFFVIASDGLWDVVKNQQVVEVVKKFWELGEVNSAAVALQSLAVKNAIRHGGYVDDISIVIVFRP